MTARVIKVGEPANDAERRTFLTLRDQLPDGYTLVTNFELANDRGEFYEIDLAILAPHAVFLVDIKGTRGRIDVYGAKWYPEGRAAFASPLAKLRQHARVFKDQLRSHDPSLRNAYVHATVLLTAPDARLEDASGRDEPDTVHISRCLPYFQSTRHVRAGMDTNITALLPRIEQTILGKARPRQVSRSFGNYHVESRLGMGNRYAEFRARHALLGKSAGSVCLRIFPVDPLAADPYRKAEQHLIATAYEALTRLPSHPNIVAAREFFATVDNDALVLVLEDIGGTALRQILNRPDLARTFDQKIRIARDLLSALDHAHRHGVIHRNLNPDALLVGADGTTRLTDFEYARVIDRLTIGPDISDVLDPNYQAPEVHANPSNASPLSDLFAAGLICYELFTGTPGELVRDGENDEADLQFAKAASEVRPDLPIALDDWLAQLCRRRPEDRFPDASAALAALDNALVIKPPTPPTPLAQPISVSDLRNLPKGVRLGERFIVQEKLGTGKFSVVYKVFDRFGDVDRAIKLIDYDNRSPLDRLIQEYSKLSNLPEHPHVIKIHWADVLRDLNNTPYLLMDYAEGLTVDEFLREDALSLDDAKTIARHTAAGLDHLHRNRVYHQDIKPQNLFWTNKGIRIIDFNVAISDEDIRAQGGTLRYIPPDVDHGDVLDNEDKIDRDLYALGVTFYQCCTGQYPFAEGDTHRSHPLDPRATERGSALPDAWVQLLYRAIESRRVRRFTSAGEFLAAIDSLPPVRGRDTTTTFTSVPAIPALETTSPNTNPFVSHLLTLYSQSRTTNAGTRGLDTIGELTYVPTMLDRELVPAVLRGEFRLVIISGNAGDGKTAFIQKLERQAQEQGAHYERLANGARFQIGHRTFYSNYDGSQDEGDTVNDQVLQTFLAPFAGNDPQRWPEDQTRLIAINEGRLVDFLNINREQFPRLAKAVPTALSGAVPRDGVVLINLNHRAVVADGIGGERTIFDQIVQKMVAPERWEACRSCDLADRCYAHHNARTLMDPVAGSRVVERLKALYTVTHMRGKLHITLRDLRSALAFTLVGTRDCAEIHALYQNAGEQSGVEQRDLITRGFYFNAWCNSGEASRDRLINLLRDLDIGQTDNPELDRTLNFAAPQPDDLVRFSFQDRGTHDHRLLKAIFEELPRQVSRTERSNAVAQHQSYIAMARRRHYFERRDAEVGRTTDRRLTMLPYRTAENFLDLVTNGVDLASETPRLLSAINRGEGLSDPTRLGQRLALRVRQVERGTIRSYRLFDGRDFSLLRPNIGGGERFVEYLPQWLIFRYALPNGRPAELRITLDVYELLMRLDEGYRPSIEAIEGFYQTLDVFKNVLSSAPYQEVLLTETGESFYRLRRDSEGILNLESMDEPV